MWCLGRLSGNAIELSDIADNDGFVINGVTMDDQSGFSVSGAGDINGDGLDDILIGANQASPNGSESGASYLVFGKRDGNDLQLNSIALGIGGFVINGASADDQSGASVSGAGDVDGDGFDDLLVGASGVNGSRGASYVIFGGQGVSDSAMVYDGTTNTLTGDNMANQLIGGAGNDTLVGGGADVLRGGAGDDVLAISDADFAVIDGGLGIDTLRLDSMMTLNLADIPNNRLDSIEIIDLNGTGSRLALATDDILNIVGRGNTLQIDGDSTDVLNVSQAMFFDSEETRGIGGIDYRVYRANDSLGLDDSVTLLVAPDISIAIPAVELAAIQMDGFALNGVNGNDQSGRSVSGAGDVNGDGLADIITGASNANGIRGASYVVFGNTSGEVVQLGDIDNNNNDGGFVLNGVNEIDRSGFSVSGAGDVNGDGLADILIGAYQADGMNGNDSGTSYVVFGKTDGAIVNLSTIAGDGNDDGFVLNGVSGGDRSGYSVSGAGDVNGDGLDDIIIGARYANSNLRGASYVVFGKTDGGIVELSMIDNDAGFVINGANEYDESGSSVSDAGDVNGDGLDDIFIRTYYGGSHVVFGKTSGDAVQLSNIASNDGFLINLYYSDSVSGAGDVNGDGLDDIIIGLDDANDNRGASYVVFGKTSGGAVQPSNIANPNNNSGFVINGVDADDRSGRSVSGAGDINGDGLDDILIGAERADPNGTDSGASYLVFGKSDGNAVELSSIEALDINGFVINGASGGDRSALSVSGAGDVDGDGFDDLIVGAYRADPNGTNSGASYVIFGGRGVSDSAIVGDEMANTLTGSSMANQLIGGAGNDTLIGNGGEDVLRGGAGDDILAISNSTISNTDSVSIDGGLGNDTLRFDAPITLDLSMLGRSKIRSIETIDLANDGDNSTLSLGLSDVLAISAQTTLANPLRILGDGGDRVNLSGAPTNGIAGSWADADDDNTYSYTASSGILANIFIDSDIMVMI